MRAWIRLGFLAGLLTAGSAAAEAWTRAAGEGFIAMAGRMYRASGYQKSGSDFQLEHGLAEGVTAGAAFSYEADTLLRQESVARGFLRVRLWRDKNQTLSAQVDGEALIASRNAGGLFDRKGSDGARIGVAYGRGFDTPLGPGWAEAAAVYRKRFGADADEFRLDLTAGVRPTENWVAFAQAFGARSLRNAGPLGLDYDTLRLSASVGYRITESRTMVLSVTKDALSRNLRPGVEAAVTIWIDY